MFTLVDILQMVKECKEEEKKRKIVPHYYMKDGETLRRSYDDIVYTDRYKELFYDPE